MGLTRASIPNFGRATLFDVVRNGKKVQREAKSHTYSGFQEYNFLTISYAFAYTIFFKYNVFLSHLYLLEAYFIFLRPYPMPSLQEVFLHPPAPSHFLCLLFPVAPYLYHFMKPIYLSMCLDCKFPFSHLCIIISIRNLYTT